MARAVQHLVPLSAASGWYMCTHMGTHTQNPFSHRIFDAAVTAEARTRGGRAAAGGQGLEGSQPLHAAPVGTRGRELTVLSPQSIFKSSPVMGCFLFGLPLGVISIMCYGIYTADTDGGYIEERYEVSKGEIEGQEAAEESREQQEPRSGHSPASAGPGPKDVLEKKTD